MLNVYDEIVSQYPVLEPDVQVTVKKSPCTATQDLLKGAFFK